MTTPATTSAVSRRSVLTGLVAGAAGTALAVAPVRAFDAVAAAAPAADGVFGYGVASGDPTATSVIIWTRATYQGAAPGEDKGTTGYPVRWELATDSAFSSVVASGTEPTSSSSDYTVKVDVTGLSPYTRYYYRFSANGQTSRTGRTQTAGDEAGVAHALRIALVSCSNYTGGYFTAYRAIGQRDDLDFVLHVGDYIYEYGESADAPDRYGPAALKGVRDGQPAGEILSLQDYRLRHALTKADPDQALAHQQHPWITIFDDHEVANNTWDTGAENHTDGTGPGGEGDFFARRARAYQVYLEWMPFRLPDQGQAVPHQGTRFFKRFTFGALADLSVLETRQNRSRQVEFGQSKGGGFVPAAAVQAQLSDAARHLPEPEQLQWLKDGTATGGVGWHLIGNQVVMTRVNFGPAFSATSPALVNSDQWDGYQADQTSLFTHLASQPRTNGDAVVLTGDIHSSWANELPLDPTTATYGAQPAMTKSGGVEFVCASVTSDGFYEIVSAAVPATTPTAGKVGATRGATGGITTANPWVKYLDGVGHGWTLIDVTPQRVQADFHLTPVPTADRPDPRTDPTALPMVMASMQTLAGSRLISAASTPVGPRSDLPRDASLPTAVVPEHVGPAAVAGVLAAGAALAWHRRRQDVEAGEQAGQA